MHVGDHDRRHAGGERGADAGLRVLQHEAVPRGFAQPLRCREEDVGLGLAARDFVAAHQRDEAGQERGARELGLRAVAARGRGHGLGDALPVEPVQEFEQARLEGDAFALDDRVVRRVPRAHQVGGRVVVAVVIRDDRLAVAEVAADHRLRERQVELDAECPGRVDPRLRRQPLGVEHQAVHVEDDGGGPALRPRRARHRT